MGDSNAQFMKPTNGSNGHKLEPIDFGDVVVDIPAPVADDVITAQYNKSLLPIPKAEKKTRLLRFDMSKPEQAAAFKQWDEWVNTNANAGARTMDCILLHKPLTLGDVDWFTSNFPAMTAAIQIKSDGVLQAEVDDLKAQVKLLGELVMANTNDIQKHGRVLAWMAPIVQRVGALLKQHQMKVSGIVTGVQNRLKKG